MSIIIALSLVSSVPRKEIGSEERLWNDLIFESIGRWNLISVELCLQVCNWLEARNERHAEESEESAAASY